MSASDIKEAMKSPLVRGQYLAAIRNRGKDVLLNNMAEAMDLLIAMAAEKEAAERERAELRACHASFAREADSTKAELRTLREWIKTVEAERDKAFAWHSSLLKKYEPLEAELRLRDAATGEPLPTQLVYSSALPKFIGDTDEIESYSCFISGKTPPRKTMTEAYADAKQVCGELYTAAQPAVLPPDITFESKGFVSLTSEDFAYNRALEDARKLGAQPQKSVICPPVQYLPKYAADDGHCTTGKLVPNKRTELRDTEWREALDAAGVKWEVKNSDG